MESAFHGIGLHCFIWKGLYISICTWVMIIWSLLREIYDVYFFQIHVSILWGGITLTFKKYLSQQF